MTDSILTLGRILQSLNPAWMKIFFIALNLIQHHKKQISISLDALSLTSKIALALQ
jgi:hypothetical protein